MKRLTITALMISMTACGVMDTEGKGKKAEQNDPEIAGEWQSNCAAADIADVIDLAYTQKEFSFSAIGDFDQTERFYSSENCTDPGFTYKVVGTYAALGKMPENKDIKKVNFTVDRALVVVNSENAVDMLNTTSLCGKDDWKVGAETDVTGLDCAGFSVNKGDVIFDVYNLDNDQLTFGQRFFFLSSDDADDRPDNVETDVVYTRK